VKSKRGHRHGKGPAPEVGDYVQWTSHGVDQFNPARKVRQILDRHAWVDGSQTGIPISEVTVAEPPAPILVALLIVGQMRPDALCHHHNERPIIHVQPITAPNKLIVGVACESGYRAHYQGQVGKSGSCITLAGMASWFDQIPL
jgi:hypothetical protein